MEIVFSPFGLLVTFVAFILGARSEPVIQTTLLLLKPRPDEESSVITLQLGYLAVQLLFGLSTAFATSIVLAFVAAAIRQ